MILKPIYGCFHIPIAHSYYILAKSASYILFLSLRAFAAVAKIGYSFVPQLSKAMNSRLPETVITLIRITNKHDSSRQTN